MKKEPTVATWMHPYRHGEHKYCFVLEKQHPSQKLAFMVAGLTTLAGPRVALHDINGRGKKRPRAAFFMAHGAKLEPSRAKYDDHAAWHSLGEQHEGANEQRPGSGRRNGTRDEAELALAPPSGAIANCASCR